MNCDRSFPAENEENEEFCERCCEKNLEVDPQQ